jgi:uncharacterized phage protein (TIGR01671 family)
MREIKFRAWVKDDNKMIHSPPVDTNDLASKEMVSFWSFCEDYTTYKDDVILMQFTGLLDKNGKGIYEGDIVMHPVLGFDKVQPGEVRYIQAAFVIAGADYTATGVTGFQQRNLYEMSQGLSYEVIGNIYENPELLKGE